MGQVALHAGLYVGRERLCPGRLLGCGCEELLGLGEGREWVRKSKATLIWGV